jgi:hypothetical protein
MRGTVHEALLGFRQQALQFLAATDHPALRRGPGAQAAAQRAHAVIGVGLFGGDFLHPPFDRTWRSSAGQKKVMAARGLAVS